MVCVSAAPTVSPRNDTLTTQTGLRANLLQSLPLADDQLAPHLMSNRPVCCDGAGGALTSVKPHEC